jgi:tetratricopeptide (TPR) repeat protein
VPPGPETSNDLTKIALVCIAGVLLAFLAATDWDRVDWNVAMDALKRLLFVCVLTVGCAVVALKSLKEQVVDDRPAEWIRGAMTIAVMIFLVHNLIDFSMFETSATFIAAMLAGTTWGAGLPERSEPRGILFARMGVGVVAFIAAFAAWAVPTILAESAAGTADDLLRNQRFAEAARLYYSAWQTWPAYADYPYRAARAAAIMGSTDDAELEQLLTAAIDDNPHNVKYYLMRAQWEQRRASPRIDRIRADYDRVLAIDPNNIASHLEYAEVLRHFNQPAAAVQQLEAALRYNDGLDPHDPRRLPADRVAAIDQTLRTLKR